MFNNYPEDRLTVDGAVAVVVHAVPPPPALAVRVAGIHVGIIVVTVAISHGPAVIVCIGSGRKN